MQYMNKCLLFFIINLIVVPKVFGDSFLKPTYFPTTFNDLSFTERVAVIKEGYEPYESEFDADGRCVKNCAYTGITLKQEQERSVIDTQNALAESVKYEHEQQTPKLSVDVNNIVSATGCANRNPGIKSGAGVPWGEPVIGIPKISSPYDLNRVHPITGKNKPHYGIDYAVGMGTMVYSPASGRVVRVWNDKSGCGYGVKIRHDDGTYAVYCHLSDEILVSEGDNVSAGCGIAKSGNSGGSTGPHLHYGLKNKNDNFINPASYTGRGY